MSKKYLEKMALRISAGASNLARLWSAKMDLIGPGGDAFDVITDLQLATMVSIGQHLGFRPVALLRFILRTQ